jgi:hypothetical protein
VHYDSRPLGHAKLDSTALSTRVATKTIQQVMSPLEHIAVNPHMLLRQPLEDRAVADRK